MRTCYFFGRNTKWKYQRGTYCNSVSNNHKPNLFAHDKHLKCTGHIRRKQPNYAWKPWATLHSLARRQPTVWWGWLDSPFFTTALAVLLQGEGSSAYCPLLAASINIVKVLGVASMLHVTLMNMERYVAIKHSLKYITLVTRRRLLRCSVFVWVVSFIVTLPFPLPGNDIYLVITSLMGFLCMCNILFCQIVIFLEIKRHRICITAHQVSTEKRQKFLKDKKAFQYTTTIFFLLLLAHTPLFVVRMLITNSIIQSLNVAYSSLMLAVFAVIINSLKLFTASE